MASVGIRELKEHTSEILRRVRDDGETVDITYRGEIVATIAPKRRSTHEEIDAFWDRQRKLIEEIAARSSGQPIDAVELLEEERREISPEEDALLPTQRAMA